MTEQTIRLSHHSYNPIQEVVGWFYAKPKACFLYKVGWNQWVYMGHYPKKYKSYRITYDHTVII